MQEQDSTATCSKCGKTAEDMKRKPGSTTRRFVRGLCYSCYRRERRDGTLEKTFSDDIKERFFSKVAVRSSGCWEWQGCRNPDGYGKFGESGTVVLAHRFSHEIHVGPIHVGKVIDHLCRNPACVNPEHLEVVTHRENCRRGIAGDRMKARAHCPQGHEYTEENTYVNPGRPNSRTCRTCSRTSSRKSKAAARAKRLRGT